MSSTPCWSCGSLPAPRLVSRRCSVSPGSAPMRVCCRYSVSLGVLLARTPVPASTASPLSRHRGRFISQSLTLLLVGRAAWMHLQRRQNHLPAPPARTAPLRASSPSSALREDSSQGSRERKNPFQSFHINIYFIATIRTPTYLLEC